MEHIAQPPRPRRPFERVVRRHLPALLCLIAALGGSRSTAAAAPRDGAPGAEPPTAFREILEDPRITDALVWEGPSGPRAYPHWAAGRREELHRWLAARERGERPDSAAAFGDGPWLSAGTAWRVYLAHVTHALWIEQRREVPWSLRSLTPDQVALLLDARHLLAREPGGERYAFGPAGAVAAWDPAPVFDFLRRHELLAPSQEETVYSLADWVRHSVRPLPKAKGARVVPEVPPPVESVLASAAAGRPTVFGCETLSGLLSAALRSANVPVRVAASPFAHRGGGPALHSRIELPTLGRGLVHSSELHTHLALPSGNAIPTGALFPTLGWIRDHIEAPRHLDCDEERRSCHTEAEQALFNSARRLLALAAIHLPDGLLIDRASDLSVSEPPERLFDTLASGCAGAPAGTFVRPLFEDSERREIARRADQEIERTGGGDWARGAETVRRRWQQVLENR